MSTTETPSGRKKAKGDDLGEAIAERPHERIIITAPKFRTATFLVRGESPYVQNRMAQKKINAMREKQELGSLATKGKKREPRDFDADYLGAFHIADSTDGWPGIPAPAFRNAMIRACSLVGFMMTMAKMSVFIEADGFDRADGMPLVRIVGEPERSEMPARNASGVMDIRVRPMWRKWTARVRVRYDADQFTDQDVANLLLRAGLQVGIGEGRATSPKSHGIGWGFFSIAE